MKLHIKTRHPYIRKEEIDSIISTNQEYLEQMAKLTKQILATVTPKKKPKTKKEPRPKKESAPTFTCPACDYTSDRPYRIAQHIMKRHEKKLPYRSDILLISNFIMFFVVPNFAMIIFLREFIG